MFDAFDKSIVVKNGKKKTMIRFDQYNHKPLVMRFLLKNRENINHYEYKAWRSFRAPKSPLLIEAMMIDRLLAFSTPLKETYTVFHELTDAFRLKDSNLFFSLLKELPETLGDRLRNLKTFCFMKKELPMH